MGESLGENGFYPHGFPYALAPKEQIEIPMIFWASEDFKQQMKLDWACLKIKPTTASATIIYSVAYCRCWMLKPQYSTAAWISPPVAEPLIPHECARTRFLLWHCLLPGILTLAAFYRYTGLAAG